MDERDIQQTYNLLTVLFPMNDALYPISVSRFGNAWVVDLEIREPGCEEDITVSRPTITEALAVSRKEMKKLASRRAAQCPRVTYRDEKQSGVAYANSHHVPSGRPFELPGHTGFLMCLHGHPILPDSFK